MRMTDPSASSRVATGPLVVAVVLTWNDTDMTRECISSLLHSDYRNLHVLLVDNGSAKPCGATIKAEFPSIELLVLRENRGFTGGGNAGIRRALEFGPEYIHLIGNDSTFEQDTLSRLVAELNSCPDAGGASPLVLYPGDEQMVQYYWGTLDRDLARTERFDLNVPRTTRDWPTRKTEFVPFIAVMFRAEALRQVGVMDETLGTCWEDYDLTVRFQDAGWHFLTVGDALAVHKNSRTTGTHSPYITYYMVRNRLICLFRYRRSGSSTLRRLLFLLRTFWWQFKSSGWTNWRCHLAYARGVLHFGLGLRGEGHAPKSRSG